MSSDILFEISKYLDDPLCIVQINNSKDKGEVFFHRKQLVVKLLENKLQKRPSFNELVQKNIIRKEMSSFFTIHELLKRINFPELQNAHRISPLIANRAKKLDFEIRRKHMIFKLGIEEAERKHKRENDQ